MPRKILQRQRRKCTKCQVIDSHALLYSHLGAIAIKLQKANCDLAAVRERLPYTMTKAE